ncbi:hypothetical protein DL96DRAFT_1714493 [Flagelloscypha sp. PMI_526]|nr:hypothetical protein DL96DRAFT_1714493 [Flagelloscypha sp. PMI_526]
MVHFQPFMLALATVATVLAASVPREKVGDNVFVSEKVVHKLLDEAPFIVDETETVTWTQAESTATAT